MFDFFCYTTRRALHCFRDLRHLVLALFTVSVSAIFSGCTPTYDWRDVRGAEAPYTVLLPGKPSTHAREINLGGIRATMTMRAAEVENVTFAVGTAELPDANQAQAVLQVMKTTMVGNIGGIIRQEKIRREGPLLTIDVIAGPHAGAADDAKAMHAKFIAKDRRVYQVVAVGREKSIRIDAVDTFLSSFKTE